MSGQKLMVLTHSAIETQGYPSTTRTADALLALLSLERQAVAPDSASPPPVDLKVAKRAFPTGERNWLRVVSKAQQESWLQMCRKLIVPAFDITPEMITHSFVVDLKTFQPLESRIWEQQEWSTLPVDQEELVIDYIATACRILDNVGLTPEGVTSPGGFGGRTLEFYAKVAGLAVREVTGNPTPYFFKRISDPVETPVWYADRDAGTAEGEIIAATGDRTGSWTGYGEVSADYYITADLQ